MSITCIMSSTRDHKRQCFEHLMLRGIGSGNVPPLLPSLEMSSDQIQEHTDMFVQKVRSQSIHVSPSTTTTTTTTSNCTVMYHIKTGGQMDCWLHFPEQEYHLRYRIHLV